MLSCESLLETLTASSKIKTKLLNPIGVAEGMLLECQKELKQRIDELNVDVMTLRLLNSQTSVWEKELRSEAMDQCRKDVNSCFVKRSQVVDTVLSQLSFFDRIKLCFGDRTIFDTVWQDAINQSQDVVFGKSASSNREHDIEQGLLTIVSECAKTITYRAKSQGELSIEYVGKRPSVIGASKGLNRSNIVGLGRIKAPKFSRLQEDLNESFVNAIQNATTPLPSNDEWAMRIFSLLSKTSLASTIFCVSATVGPIAALSAGAVDNTTAIAASTTMLVMGAVSIPLGNYYASRSYKKEWITRADKLDRTLDAIFQKILKQVLAQLAESVAPYSRFVNGEGQHLSELQSKIDSSISSANFLRGQVNKACDL